MSVCLSVTFGGGMAGEGGQKGGRQWGGGISTCLEGEAGRVDRMDMMECLGGHEVTVFFLTNGHIVYPCNARYPS